MVIGKHVPSSSRAGRARPRLFPKRLKLNRDSRAAPRLVPLPARRTKYNPLRTPPGGHLWSRFRFPRTVCPHRRRRFARREAPRRSPTPWSLPEPSPPYPVSKSQCGTTFAVSASQGAASLPLPFAAFSNSQSRSRRRSWPRPAFFSQPAFSATPPSKAARFPCAGSGESSSR